MILMQRSKGKTVLFTVLLILLVFLVSSCRGAERDITDRDWRVGTRAIEMNFIPGGPPRIAYDDDPFEIAVEIWNRGAAPLVGDLYLTGFDEDIFSGISKRPLRISIDEHRTRFNSEGGYDVARQSGRIFLPQGVDVFSETRIVAEACYIYETQTDVPICIDPEPNKRDFASDACRPRDVSVGGGQAAPVAITNVRVEATPQKTIFRITIKNVGPGTVLDQTIVDDCLDPDITFPFTNWVDIESVRLGLDDFLQCETPNPVRLVNGVGRISCFADNLQGGTAYSTPLNVILTYGYRESIQVPIELRNTI